MRFSFKKKLVSALCLVWASSAYSAVEFKLGHFGSENHPSHIAAMQFAKQVEARTKGEVSVPEDVQFLLLSPHDLDSLLLPLLLVLDFIPQRLFFFLG